MTQFYVYEHWRRDTRVCFYVGKGSGPRAYVMRARNPHHTAIQIKLGGSVEVRFVARDLTHEDACKLEMERIAHWRALGVALANYSAGGEGGNFNPIPEVRRRISETSKGRQTRLGAKLTADQKEKIRIAQFRPAAQEAWRLKASLGPKAMAKAVKCLDDGLSFESASAAARHYGVSKSALIELCLGKNYRKSVNGLRFQYLDAS